MENERFNMSLRKYLKHVGVTSQQEIERYVREHGMEGKGTRLKVKTVSPRGRWGDRSELNMGHVAVIAPQRISERKLGGRCNNAEAALGQ